ncbi:hypothetical protein NL108_013654 [Boleophthalmus pectinirostris]|nr:hypothetical protein NL108_013654 [Boleophthalmus pectinirostris]
MHLLTKPVFSSLLNHITFVSGSDIVIFLGFGHCNCVVVGCPNSGKRLEKFVCELHKCKRESDVCDCKPLFKLFPFPTELNNSTRRRRWAVLIHRKDEKGNFDCLNQLEFVANILYMEQFFGECFPVCIAQ